MNHTVQELIHIAHRYFPPMLAGEPGYDETPEARRRRIASADARALYPTWTDMLRRIEARFPKDRHPAVLVQNLCMGFLAPDPLDDPGHERMPPEVGSTIVPGVQVGAQMPGAATLYDCLFSDAW